MSKRNVSVKEIARKEQGLKEKGMKHYICPQAASMEEFTLKTAVGVSPAMKKKDGYIVSTLF
jgi:hypothetical protein